MKRIVLIASMMAFFFARSASAAIYIVIDQFSPEKKFPIAVANLVEKKEGVVDQTGIEISNILRRNLNLAGYFDILNPSTYLDKGPALTPEELDFSKWSAIGATVFIKGSYKKSGKNLVIELRLYDPVLKTMLVGKEYKVKADKAYAAVHRFADEVMLALTGERGFYSTKIAAACGPKGKEQIVIMNVDGSDRENITDNGTMNLSPNFSPDGSQIVYTSYAKFFPELFLSKIKGGKAKRLTFNNMLNITPEFSPDGSRIAFSSSQGGDPDLYVIDTQGKKISQPTNTFGIDLSPTWSPDGHLIAFASERSGGLHIFVTDPDGSTPKRLTHSGYQNDTPAWSPRGDKIAYVKRSEGGFNIFTMNADGTGEQQLTSGSGNNENPAWSPDGRYIVFSSSRRSGANLFLMMWDGANQTQITADNQCKTPDWSNRLDNPQR